MTKLNFYLLLLAGYGIIQTSAATPSIQLEIGNSPSGCVNITDCSYGCARISSHNVKHILTPLCEPDKVVSDNLIKRITIRGSTNAPYVVDEDEFHPYTCSRITPRSRKYTCNFNISSTISESEIESAAIVKQAIKCDFDTSIAGQGKGQGDLHDCCLTSNDCRGSCFQGSCDASNGISSSTTRSSGATSHSASTPSTSPSSCDYNPTIFRQRQGQGNLNDCCLLDDDCHGSCIRGSCDKENNQPIPVCKGNAFRGKKRGEGPKGVCCDSQADCQEDCLFNTCTAPLNY
ncbi:hypothetical protein INT48_009145 [Thamnidium elegans]|uniref:Uncharacterized protein n=1 Tax=Thamnidium elegans TaxID=101142 RepID=A0A8H7VWF2_9FUNG|nr:hypothetical protein INT48_009145 [Thamnidium elegans]